MRRRNVVDLEIFSGFITTICGSPVTASLPKKSANSTLMRPVESVNCAAMTFDRGELEDWFGLPRVLRA